MESNLPGNPCKTFKSSNSQIEVQQMQSIIDNAKKKGNVGKSKSKTLNKETIYDEIEALQKELIQKEKDYQIVVEVGKLLLEKNKELTENHDSMRSQFEIALHERDLQINHLLSKTGKEQDREKEFQNELQSLKLQLDNKSNVSQHSESTVFEMYDQFSKMEEEIKQSRQIINSLKAKNKDLVEEIEIYKLDLDKLKSSEQSLKKQLRANNSTNETSEVKNEQDQEIERLEEKNRLFQKDIKKLEATIEELTPQVINFKETLEQKESIIDQLEQTLKSLSKTNQILQEKEEESRVLLEQTNYELVLLKEQFEEQSIERSNFRASSSLQKELLLSKFDDFSKIGDIKQNELGTRARRSSIDIRNNENTNSEKISKKTWKDLGYFKGRERSHSHDILASEKVQSKDKIQLEIQNEQNESLSTSHTVQLNEEVTEVQKTDTNTNTIVKTEDSQNLSVTHESKIPNIVDNKSRNFETEESPDPATMKQEDIIEELYKLRNLYKEELQAIAIFTELRERLNGSEIRNLTRLMKTENFFFDLLSVSNSIIDTVSTDIQKRVLENPSDNDLVQLLAAITFENCKLRKVSNDYAEALNRGTLDKLEEWKKKFYEEEPTLPPPPKEKVTLWGFFSRFFKFIERL